MFQDTPLADACLKNDFQSLRALLRDELAAKSIFIKGTSQDSLICTLPYSRKPSSSIVQYREIIPVDEKDEHFIEEIDQALSNFLSHLSNTDGIETTGKYRFHVGDLVKLLRGKRCSSELSSRLCLVEQSEVMMTPLLQIPQTVIVWRHLPIFPLSIFAEMSRRQ